MHTRKASFRFWVIIICLAAVLLLAACVEPETEATPTPWVNPCIEEGITTMTEDTDTQDVTTERPSREYMREVYLRHRALLLDYPHVWWVQRGDWMRAVVEKYNREGWGFTLYVSEYTDPQSLPEEQRIPECLDGVPVRIIKVAAPVPG